MKRIIYALLVVLLMSLVVSCSSSSELDPQSQSQSVGMPNPIKNYDSLEKINGIVGTHIVIPSSLPVTNVVYSTINDEIAQVDFVLDEYEWTIRGSKIVDQDISGIHSEYNEFNQGENFGLYINDYYISRFFVEDLQYTIVLNNANGYDVETYSNYELDIEIAITRASDSNGIAGRYADQVSQRATMDIDKVDDLYDITVYWPSSASEQTVWYMTGTLDGNKITYAGEDVSVYEFDEDGNETLIDSTAINNLGHFDIKDGKLYWTGAGQDQCKECIFEKIEH